MRTGLALLLVTVCISCAIQEAPPGGPVDNRPPQIVSTAPGEGEAGVSAEAEIRIAFDENMTKSRFERFFDAQPRIIVGRSGWSKNTFVLYPQDPLHPDTTYLVEINAGFSDAHGVPNPNSFRFAFATSAAIDSGSVAGHVFFRRRPSQRAMVRLFVTPVDSGFSPEGTLPDRSGAVDETGRFQFDYLPTDDRTFLVWAFEDTDNNGAFSVDGEVGSASVDTLTLRADGHQIDGLEIFIVDPKEPGQVTGRIINSTGVDSFPITLAMHELTDSLPPTYISRAGPDGIFRFPQVLKGKYALFAFMDFRADSICGTYPCLEDTTQQCLEPCIAYPDTLTMEPGMEIGLDDLILPGVEADTESDE